MSKVSILNEKVKMMKAEKPKRFAPRFWLGVFVMLMAAVLAFGLIEYFLLGLSWHNLWEFMSQNVMVALMNVLVLFLLEFAVYAVIGSAAWAAGLTGVLGVVYGYANYAKLLLREAPVLPEDLSVASDVEAMSNFLNWNEIGCAVLVVVVLLAAAGVAHWAWFRKWKYDVTWKVRLTSRGVGLLVAVAGLLAVTGPIVWREKNNQDYFSGTFCSWNHKRNYTSVGAVMGFVYNLHKTKMTGPSEYGEELVAEVKEEYSEASLEDADFDVVMIMDESFYDVNSLSAYYPKMKGDAISFVRSLMEKSGGYMYSNLYGGGTANVEFQALTGLSYYFIDGYAYTDILPKTKATVSYVQKFKDAGYSTLAVHPYFGSMYKRNFNYPTLGFDEFIDMSSMDDAERLGNSDYITDEYVFDLILDKLDSGDGKQFIWTVTMQNHSPYDGPEYAEFDYYDYDAENGTYEDLVVASYMQSVSESDKAIEKFITALEQRERKTVVIFFGDHSGSPFIGLDWGPDETATNLIYQTPFFIYANFDTGADEESLAYVKTKMGSNCMMAKMMRYTGLTSADSSDLVSSFCAEYPYLGGGLDFDESTDIFYAYWVMNYDVLGGKRYWLK